MPKEFEELIQHESCEYSKLKEQWDLVVFEIGLMGILIYQYLSNKEMYMRILTTLNSLKFIVGL